MASCSALFPVVQVFGLTLLVIDNVITETSISLQCDTLLPCAQFMSSCLAVSDYRGKTIFTLLACMNSIQNINNTSVPFSVMI